MNTDCTEKLFDDVAMEWLYLKKLSIKLSTYDKYAVIIFNHLNKQFHHYLIKNINEEMIINYFHELIDNNQFSVSTIKTIRYILKSILDYAHDKYNISTINFKIIKLAKSNHEFTVLAPDQRGLLEKYCFHHFDAISLLILLSLYGGFRVGEVAGLRWDDIDLANGIIYVNRTIERLKNNDCSHLKTKLMVLEPKTSFSKRIVPIPDFMIDYIKQFIMFHPYSCLDHYIYTNSCNIPDPRSVQYHFKRICKLLDFDINYHSLRHSYATDCVMNGIDIKSLSEILGHSGVSITLELYVHSSLDFKKRQIKKIKKPSCIAEQ